MSLKYFKLPKAVQLFVEGRIRKCRSMRNHTICSQAFHSDKLLVDVDFITYVIFNIRW